MNTTEIKDDSDYQALLAYLYTLMNALPGTAEEKELERIAILLENYELDHYPI